jgi:hypothetical protein
MVQQDSHYWIQLWNKPEVTVGDTNIIVPFSAFLDAILLVLFTHAWSFLSLKVKAMERVQYTQTSMKTEPIRRFPKGFTVYSSTPVPLALSKLKHGPFSYLLQLFRPSQVQMASSLQKEDATSRHCGQKLWRSKQPTSNFKPTLC